MGDISDKGKAGGKSSLLDALPDFSDEDLADLIAAAETAQKAKRDDALKQLRADYQRSQADFEERAVKIGFSLDDLQRPDALPGRKGSTVPPKFRGPSGEEWSGRGKAPNWLRALESAGHNKDDFRV